MPICSPETACITADTMGTFMVKEHSSPFLNFTTGVFKVTLAGMHSAGGEPGTRRYSLKVWEGSEKK